LKERIFRDEMLKEKRRRPDGRAFDRDPQDRYAKWACCRAPMVRALFTRGETQAMVTTTLGTKDDEQRIELLDRRAMSPSAGCCTTTSRPSAVGETGRSRFAGPPRNRPRRFRRTRA
jgi:polyribonucleotide nucleotidyltransferase